MKQQYILFLVGLFLAVPLFSKAQTPEKPNIVFVLADDLGWGDLSCYGHPYSQTPSLDQLASEGIRFEKFYVTGVTCCPSRTGFMTSKHPASYPNYMAEYGFAESITITEILNDNGYATGHFGKWHIGPGNSINPVVNGIYGFHEIGVIGSNHTSEGGRDVNLFKEALSFIEENKDRPFYVNIWGHITHYPVDPYHTLVDMFSDVQVDRADFGEHMQKQFDDCEALGGDTLPGNIGQSMRNYMGDVYGLDIQVGRLLDKLDELGISDNTIVIFSSDQGPAPVITASHEASGNWEIIGDNTGVIPSQNMLGYAGGLRGGKHTQFEGGVRSPFIIRWPGKTPAGVVDNTSGFSGLDFLPTICSILGIDINENLFEGEDMSDVWKGTSRSRTNPLFWKTSSSTANVSMLEGKWKLHEVDGGYTLYDLSVDEYEMTDVSRDNPDVVSSMAVKIQQWESTLPTDYNKDKATEQVYTIVEQPKPPAELLQHFDASNLASVETDLNNVVMAWHDLSDNSYAAVPGNGSAHYSSAKKFPNGLNGIDFSGGRNSLELLSTLESDTILNQAVNSTGFCVITTAYIDSFHYTWNDFFGNSSSVNYGFFMRLSPEGELRSGLGEAKQSGSKMIQPGVPVIFTFNYDADDGNYKFWCSAIDEELIGLIEPGDFSTDDPMTVGATTVGNRYFEGMIGEVQVYNTSMGAEELLDSVYSLGAKWGVDLPRIPLAPNTRIVETNWSDDDVAIIQYNAAEAPYNADKTGATDATEAIQLALDDCEKAPGGVVYLPEGIYRIDGNLKLEAGVTLRGDWKEPTEEDKSVAGTLLYIYGQKGEVSDAIDIISPIEIGASGGIRDLTIYYPEQDVSNPVPYPYTVRARSKMLTVMNVTLVNSYKGVRFENTPDYSAGHPNAYNIYGSPLKMGIRLNKAAMVPRIVGIDFDPAYWAESGLPGAPGESEIFEASRSLSSVGLEIEQSDNGIIGDVKLRGYNVGIGIGVNGAGSNMKVFDFDISGCRIGVHAVNYKSQGWTFTKGSIDVDGDGAIALYQTGREVITCNDVAFRSSDQLILSTTGNLSLTNCHFEDWNSKYGINLQQGSLISYGNIFSKSLAAEQANIYLASSTEAAAISGNTFENSPAKIVTDNSNTQSIAIDTINSYDVYRHEYPEYEPYHYFFPAKTGVNSLFNVKDYGAVADMVTDNTDAFKAALDAADQYGGGTVYVPGGAYRIDGDLEVPTGVELRGVHDLPVYTGHGRSILLSYVDMDNPGETPFIKLKEASGIRGMLIMRPQQVYNEFDPNVDTIIYDLPFILRAAGDDCSIVNIAISNADKGIDLSSSGGGHFINWYMTAPIGLCLNIQTGENPVIVNNMQTNPGLFRDIKGTLNWNLFTEDAVLIDHFSNNIAPLATESRGLYPSGTAVNIKGDGAITFNSNFYNNPYNGFVINGSPQMKSYLSGGEGEIFYAVESEGSGPIDLEIIANTYHPLDTDRNITGFGSYEMKPESEGIVKILNTTSFGDPDVGYRINNGNLIIQSAYQTVNVPTWVEARGDARVSVEGCFLRRGSSNFHGVARDDSIEFKISGTYSDNNYRVSSEIEVGGSTPKSVSRVDVLRPTVPQNFQVDSVSTTSIHLSWDPSTDNSAVEGYELFRDYEKIAELDVTNYSDAGLLDSTRYVYQVYVFDDSNNYSWTDSLAVWTDAIVIPDDTTQNPGDTTDIFTPGYTNEQLKIYPNPSRGEIIIALSNSDEEELIFSIYSVEGTLLRVMELSVGKKNKEYQINLEDFGKGIYIYRLAGGHLNNTGKIVIDK